MKVAVGMLSHETDTFSTVKTSLRDFNPLHGNEIVGFYKGTRSGVGGFIDVLEKEGIEIVPTVAAGATPAGPLDRRDYDYLVGEIVEGVASGGVDEVLLALHGAMVAQGVPEAEGTLLRAVKGIVGDKPVICTLDLHGLISETIVSNVDAIFGYDTNPHMDMYERRVEAAEVMVATLEGRVKPTTAFKKVRMMPPTINQRTTEGPMVKLLRRAREMEEEPGVINVCLFPAFPYADVKRVGSSAVAVTDDDPALAAELCDELGGMFWDLREEFLKPLTPVEEAVDRAVRAEEGPIILADVADNPGGGSPGDGTVILRELIRRGAKDVGFAIIKDPEAVERAIGVGVRGTLEMEIGGKTDGYHGRPVPVKGGSGL